MANEGDRSSVGKPDARSLVPFSHEWSPLHFVA